MPRFKGQLFVQRAVAVFNLLKYIQAVSCFDHTCRIHLAVDVITDGGIGVQVDDIKG